MFKRIGTIIGLALVIGGAFVAGKFFAAPTTQVDIANYEQFVRTIAELATVEVQGNANINQSNVKNDGSFSDEMKRLFMEKTIQVQVPYSAKYGAKLDTAKLAIEKRDSLTIITLPKPQLLSYELQLHKMRTSNQKGWLIFSDDDTYLPLQKKLYEETRKQLAGNTTYLQLSERKLAEVITAYGNTLGLKITVAFK